MDRGVGVLALACAVGCAAAEDPASSAGPTPPPATTQDAGSTGAGPITTGINPPDPEPDDDDGADETSSGDGADETTTGDPGEGSSESTSSEDDTSTGDPDLVRCEFPTTCNGSETAGGVSGDTAAPALNVMGDGPMWVQVQVSENDSGILANSLEATVSLLSQGADWDLRAYLGDAGDTNGCGGDEMRSETTGEDTVTFSWGESGTLANNTDDGTFIAVEIFPKEDLCTEGASWTLTVTGNG